MEIIAITGILGTLAVIVLVILRPWDGLSRLAAVYLFFTYRPRPRPSHARPRGVTRPPQGVWDDGPVPPIGSMDFDTELEYRAMAGLTPREPPADTLSAELRAAGPELDASGAAQRTSWAEPRPALLLLRRGGPERPPDGPGGGPQPPGPAERTDGQGVPPGGWRGQFDALAPPEPPYPLPWPRAEGDWLPRALPPWATDGGVWRIPAGVYDSPADAVRAAVPEPPEPELPPSGDWAPGTGPPEDDPGPIGLAGLPDYPQVIRLGVPGPQSPDVHFQDDRECWCGTTHNPGDPEAWTAQAMRWHPSRLASSADAEHAAELAARDADAAEFSERLAAGNRAYLWELRRGFLASQGLI